MKSLLKISLMLCFPALIFAQSGSGGECKTPGDPDLNPAYQTQGENDCWTMCENATGVQWRYNPAGPIGFRWDLESIGFSSYTDLVSSAFTTPHKIGELDDGVNIVEVFETRTALRVIPNPFGLDTILAFRDEGGTLNGIDLSPVIREFNTNNNIGGSGARTGFDNSSTSISVGNGLTIIHSTAIAGNGFFINSTTPLDGDCVIYYANVSDERINMNNGQINDAGNNVTFIVSGANTVHRFDYVNGTWHHVQLR